MTKHLNLGDGIRFPIETVTDTIGILAVKGAGKTHTSMVLAEELAKLALPVVVFDVVGVCWGLRLGANGKGTGLPFYIFGGKHADLPLSPTAGKILADTIVKSRINVVLDFSEFSKSEQVRFITDFCTRLYHTNSEPVHVVMDEADDYVSQKPFKEELRCLRAVDVLVRRGRAKGVGVTLITQRAAAINKNVLTQISTLIVGRTVSPQDRKAVQAWVDAHGTPEQKEAFWDSIASLPTNEKWFWSPARNVFVRGAVRQRETYDSSFTPKIGSKRVEPKALEPLEIDKLRGELAATIEQAKADDPKELRARIRQLEADLAKKPAAPAKVEQVYVLDPKLVGELRKVVDKIDESIATKVLEPIQRLVTSLDRATEARVPVRGRGLNALLGDPETPPKGPKASLSPAAGNAPARRPGAGSHLLDPTLGKGPTLAKATPRPTKALRAERGDGKSLIKCERALLSVFLSRTRQGLSTRFDEAAIIAGYSPRSSGVDRALSTLRAGLIEGDRYALRSTSAAEGLVNVIPIPSGSDVITLACKHLIKCEREMLHVVAQATPGAVSRTEMALIAGYSPTSSGVDRGMSTLRGLDLISGADGTDGRGEGPYVLGPAIRGLFG